MHYHTLAPLETAADMVTTERNQLRTEAAAFESFAQRVTAIDDQSVTLSTQSAGQPLATVQHGETAMARVRSAFRDTVMAVSHYEEIYDEPLAVHAEGELGPDIATAMQGDAPFSPGFNTAMMQAVERGLENRAAVLDLLETETDSLASAQSALASVATVFRDYSTTGGSMSAPEGDNSLGTADQRCQAVVDERQALIQDRYVSPMVDGHDLCAYLYGDVRTWTYPVLSVAASLQQDLDALTHRKRSNDPPQA